MLYTITFCIASAYLVASILFGGYIFTKYKDFDFALTLLVYENIHDKQLSQTGGLLLKGIIFLRRSILFCGAILLFTEFVKIARL